MQSFKQHLIIAEELNTKTGYTYTIASRLGDTLRLAEELFGNRDKSYTILGTEFVETDRPQIWYPGNCKHIVIQLTFSSLFDENQALYQLSHETIHLLSPLGDVGANVLEEGLATYFSGWYLSQQGQPNWKPTLQEYKDALDLTKLLLNIDSDIIKKVRMIEPTISKLMPEHFFQVNEAISIELLEKLCSKFQS